MTCEHAETTTLLWLYGEGEAAHAEHLATCAECSEVARLHADVISVTAGNVGTTAAPSRGVGSSWGLAVLGLLAAAVAAFTLLPGPPPVEDTVATTASFEWTPPLTDFDAELDALDAELDALSADIASL